MTYIIRAGENPRDVLPRHRERGPKRYEYTVEDVARVTGYSVLTVRKRKIGTVADLLALGLRVLKRDGRRSVPVLPGGLTVLGLAAWENRWPRWDLYRCLARSCDELVLGSGLCPKHGFPMLALRRGYFCVRVGLGWEALHRLILQPSDGLVVHHIDGNKWNNRLENLELAEVYEHGELSGRGPDPVILP